jgi:hypothetical protein
MSPAQMVSETTPYARARAPEKRLPPREELRGGSDTTLSGSDTQTADSEGFAAQMSDLNGNSAATLGTTR